ncbi:MAG: Brp/Blh family beta-carotene 15,15'-dioxygenase, partial [Amnibacterium sp.]
VTVLAGALALAGIGIPEAAQVVPFLVSLVLLGLPHGAIDHLVPSRLAGRAPRPAPMLAVVGLYAVLGAADLAMWALAPAVGFVAFILLTWFHWGQGDLFVAAARDPRMGGRAARAAHLAARGAIPMLVPLAAQPAAYASVIAATTALFAPGAAGLPALAQAPAVRLTALGVLLAVVAADLALDRGRERASRAGETVLLLAFFAVVPPVLAVGLYFCLWHSLRHIVRLQLLDGPSAAALRSGRVLPALARFARAAAPLTVVALALLGVLAAVLPHRAGPAGLLGVYLVLISALTVPHVAVVALMDRAQHVWGTQRSWGRTTNRRG